MELDQTQAESDAAREVAPFLRQRIGGDEDGQHHYAILS